MQTSAVIPPLPATAFLAGLRGKFGQIGKACRPLCPPAGISIARLFFFIRGTE